MAKTNKKGKVTRRPTKAETKQRQKIKEWVLRFFFVLLLIFAAFRMGVVGVTAYNLFRLVAGSAAYYLIVGCLAYTLFSKWLERHEGLISGFILTLIGILLSFQAYLDMQYQGSELFGYTLQLSLKEVTQFQVKEYLGGGMLGALFYLPTSFLFATIGTFFISALLLVFGLFFMSPWSMYDLADAFARIRENYKKQAAARAEKRAVKAAEKAAREEAEKQARRNADQEKMEIASPEIYLEDEREEEDDSFTIEATRNRDVEIITEDSDFSHRYLEEEFPVLLAEEMPLSEEVSDVTEEIQIDFRPKKQMTYRLPTVQLLAPMKVKNQLGEKKIVRQNIKVLEETFASFGIKVTVERAEIGPSVTKYEVKPAVGVRVNRISNLADDLALALAAKDVRIEAPIPGKSLVGIEVPNSEVATVPFRELWEQSQTDAGKLLEIPLGKAVNGSVRSFDLGRMPHLLVAGSTGSGKSVAVNGIIASILMKAGPDQVKFMMIDPKMVELSVYNDIPHLLIPVVTNPRKAARALQKVVDEMEKRYELFSQIGVRNLEGYNAKVETFNAQSQEKQIPLPLIVVIVDELADLMMVASKEVEDAIIRLGQKARAAGIHMILATQRPSVDVISGLIKANVPSRIAFAVSSGTDSRTILDVNGAEKLLGRGDMLFKPIDENHPIRLQGSFISDADVEAIVDFIKDQADAEYDESFDPGEVSETEGELGFGEATSEGDPLFSEARALVVETQKASASMLQRRLSVGFNRATRLMEELEEAGVIGPAEGTKPRKVLETQ